MNEYAEYFVNSPKFAEGIRSGRLGVSDASQRVFDKATGRFVGALVPGREMSRLLLELPTNPSAVSAAIQASSTLAKHTVMLNALQLTSSIGALASVANLGVSCAGFALVLHRLSRIEGKLDTLLSKIDLLQRAVDGLRMHQNALSLARVRAAGESLDRALAADTEVRRKELASHARELFQESKALYLELWRAVQPWSCPDIPMRAALEMQARYVACAIGEIQAELIAGDSGSFLHAAGAAARDLELHMAVDGPAAFRARSDAACLAGKDTLALFQAGMSTVAADLKTAAEVTAWSAKRLANFSHDVELLRELNVRPHHLIDMLREADGADFYLLHPQCPVHEFPRWLEQRMG